MDINQMYLCCAVPRCNLAIAFATTAGLYRPSVFLLGTVGIARLEYVNRERVTLQIWGL